MSPVLLYYVKANILLSIFTIIFLLFYQRETHFHLNRSYLLVAIFSALVFPIVRLTAPVVEAFPLPVNVFTVPAFIEPQATIAPVKDVVLKQPFSIFSMITPAYWTGVLLLSVRFLLFLLKLILLTRKGVLSRVGNIFFVSINRDIQPFSFFNLVFFNSQMQDTPEFKTVMAHEQAHVRQWHSIDLLFTEILVILFWFNPFVFLLKNAVRANHEFLADSTVLQNGNDKLDYLKILAVQAINPHYGGLASSFKSSTLKNRIVMISKKKTSLLRSIKYVFVVPFMILTLFAFSMIKDQKIPQLKGRIQPTSSIHILKNSQFHFEGDKQLEYIGASVIINESDDKIIINNVKEMTCGNLKFRGDKFEYDSKRKILKVLGDACYMEKIEGKTGFTFSMFSDTTYNFIPPISTKKVKRMSGMGERIHPITKKKHYHSGYDFAAKSGTPIIAIADGVVDLCENEPKSYGKYVVVHHANGISSLYAQMSEFAVKKGDKIKQGTVIGYVGSSGISTGPHLHFEMKKDGEYVNPSKYINLKSDKKK